jgi:CheY-like chemotaxis protein/anti-sigma regulatory factor (Ser/Thr protein kinase)
MSEALQEQVYGELNDKVLDCLHRIEESGHHLLQLITDILDLSKISVGKLELDIASVSLESVCQASLGFIKQQAQKKQIKVLSAYDQDVTKFHADELRIKQVLVNLLTNAVKFTPEGGTVGLEVEGDAERQKINFTVWDTGIGIAKEDMERLFEPFVQVDNPLSRQSEGTGLGLSLVHQLVELHGGSISVESEVGKGSRFTVSLPWKESGDREIGSWGDRETGRWGTVSLLSPSPHLPISPSPHLPISLSPQSATILIAEDNESNLQTLSVYLAAKGYRVILAQNGKEVVEGAQKKHPDLVLMDIQMPEMNGVEAIRHIRADETTRAIPIIAVTALVMPGDRERCLEAGADEYLSKPVSLRKLSELFEKLLTKEDDEQHE